MAEGTSTFSVEGLLRHGRAFRSPARNARRDIGARRVGWSVPLASRRRRGAGTMVPGHPGNFRENPETRGRAAAGGRAPTRARVELPPPTGGGAQINGRAGVIVVGGNRGQLRKRFHRTFEHLPPNVKARYGFEIWQPVSWGTGCCEWPTCRRYPGLQASAARGAPRAGSSGRRPVTEDPDSTPGRP